jgi:competence protein ComGD
MGGTQPLFFQYNLSGNINKFGSFYVEINNQFYRFTILIGSGRFYVVKE